MTDQNTTQNAAPGGTGAAVCSVFRCVAGCDKPWSERCQITVTGKPPMADEKLYMCPFNHWRSARWEQTPNHRISETDTGAKGATNE